ncbi:MAG: ABC transporter substrate-binding protein [Myxococcales bacterium]|nr:ABC transporter substrate-binding protein [Myxococcales bacterium]
MGDTAGDADRAPQIVEDMVQRQHVAAIIGPVGSIESHTAARAAERLEVPIVVLSSRADLTRLGTFVFRHRLTRSAQAEAIGRYAVEALGLKTFAILYPHRLRDRDDAGVLADGDPARRRDPRRRGLLGQRRRPERADQEAHRPASPRGAAGRPALGGAQPQVEGPAQHVPPVVDFEALFIPDGGQRVRLMLPFLAYWDIEVKNDPALSPLEFASKYAGDTPQLVQILGASGFNDPRLTRDPPTQALNALFVDAFWTESAAAAPFVEAWVAEHGRPPPVLAAHAYDAAKLLARVVPGATDRDAVRRGSWAWGPTTASSGRRGWAATARSSSRCRC